MLLTKMVSYYVGDMLRRTWHLSYDSMDTKVSDYWGISFSDLMITGSAAQPFLAYTSYLLLTLIGLSDLTKLLKLNEITNPRFLPDWSNKTTLILGSLALLSYLLSGWLFYIALLMAGAV